MRVPYYFAMLIYFISFTDTLPAALKKEQLWKNNSYTFFKKENNYNIVNFTGRFYFILI